MDRAGPDTFNVILTLVRTMKFTDITQGAMNRLLSMVETIAEEIGGQWIDNREHFTNELLSIIRKYGMSTGSLKEHFHYFSRIEPPEHQDVASSVIVSSSHNDTLEPNRKLFFAPSYQEFLIAIKAESR